MQSPTSRLSGSPASPKRSAFTPPSRISTGTPEEQKVADRPTPETVPSEQLREYESLKAAEDKMGGLQAGKGYCLLSRKWFVQWLQWVGHPGAQAQSSPSLGMLQRTRSATLGSVPVPHRPVLRRLASVPGVTVMANEPFERQRSWTKDRPGPIDNELLLEEGDLDKLRTTVFERLDFEIVSLEMWDVLHSWYGGGPKIVRRAVQTLSGTFQIEVHWLKLRGCTTADSTNVVSCELSLTATVRDLKLRLCHSLKLDPGSVRILNLGGDEDDTLDSCRVIASQLVLLDERQSDGTWGRDKEDELPKSSESKAVLPYSWDSSLAKQSVGLDNLGNTCFMNSSLQCLGNIPQLRDYFLTDKFKSSLRIYGKVTEGTGGRVAKEFGTVMQALWDPDADDSVPPWDFKKLVGQVEERFTGNKQHDSMEFIEFLVDGLKEDCNKVKGKKLYVERVESNGRPDAQVALEAASRYFWRQDSDIDDLFVGFFRSTVTCPEEDCRCSSVAFDPFLSMKVPIMSAERSRIRSFTVDVVPLASAGRPIERHRVSIQKFGSASILVEAIAIAAGVDPDSCILVEIFKSKIYKFFEEADRLEDISSEDVLLLYELLDAPSFRKPATKRWGGGADVAAGDVVIVTDNFLSNSKAEGMIMSQQFGYVQKIDEDGDAYIHFDDFGWHDPQWVFSVNLCNLMRDLDMYSDLQKRDPDDDDKVYTFKQYIDMWAGEDYSLQSLRAYWNEGMVEIKVNKAVAVCDSEGDKAVEIAPEVCGVVVNFRTIPEESEKKVSPYFGLPFAFCTPRETSVTKLQREVRSQLEKRGMPGLSDEWTFYRTVMGSSYNTEVLLLEEAEEAEDSISIGERQYLVLEWGGMAAPKAPQIVNEDLDDEEEEEVSLNTCFEWMTAGEQLSEEDCVFCQRCKELRQSYKKVEIWSLPSVLVLQLKRFEFTGVERHRVNTKVQFPLEGLDLREFCLSDTEPLPKGECLRAGQSVEIQGMESTLGKKLNGAKGTIEYMDSGSESARWCVQLDDAPEMLTLVAPENLKPARDPEAEARTSPPPIFDLVALSKHIGGASYGHYVAYARSSQTGVWSLFDDGDVSEVLPQEVSAEQEGAYVLFYLRRDCRPTSWGEP